jgi:hypothetical protein
VSLVGEEQLEDDDELRVEKGARHRDVLHRIAGGEQKPRNGLLRKGVEGLRARRWPRARDSLRA